MDLQHIYIDGSKFEANANKYSWVWKKSAEKSRYKLFAKITSLFELLNDDLKYDHMSVNINTEYAPDYLRLVLDKLKEIWQIDETAFVHGSGHRKSDHQRKYEQLKAYTSKLEEYVEDTDMRYFQKQLLEDRYGCNIHANQVGLHGK